MHSTILVFLSLIVASLSSNSVPTKLFAGNAALPWMTPIDLCLMRKEDNAKTSHKLVCQDNPNGAPSLVLQKFSGKRCDTLLSSTTIDVDGQTIKANCREAHEEPGFSGPIPQIDQNYAVVTLYAANLQGAVQDRNQKDTAQTLANNTDALSVLLQKTNMVSCNRDNNKKRSQQYGVVTETCFPYNWEVARGMLADDPKNIGFEANKTYIFDGIFPQTTFWYKVQCNHQKLLWQQFSDPACTLPIPNAKPFLVEQGCRDWRVFGSYWDLKVQCTGFRIKNKDIRAILNSQSRAWPHTLALAVTLLLSLFLSLRH